VTCTVIRLAICTCGLIVCLMRPLPDGGTLDGLERQLNVSWGDVKSVLASEPDRRTALRHTVPFVVLCAVSLYVLPLLQRWHDPPSALVPILFVLVCLPLRLYLVAGWIRRPPTREQTIVRVGAISAVLIGSFMALYFIILR
jgi:hypothetical protein